MMRRHVRGALAIGLVAAAGLALAGAGAAKGPVRYVLPDEPVITLPAGQGAELAQGTCSACHSLDYIQTQPPGKGAQFWRDEVAKMGKLYGARIDPKDAEEIGAYLGRTYG
jgi:mono/diheme cytochrome c family protein